MTEEREPGTRPATRPADDTPYVVIQKRKRPTAVWAVPIVAAAVGGWLGIRTIMEKGPTITITFSSAQGLQAGKTQIRFKDLVIGTVESIQLAKDLSHVVLKAEMVSGSQSILTEGAQFWVVRPRIGATGVSGLDTLISGAYIGISAGKGRRVRSFRGLELPPPNPDDRPGLRVVLQSDTLGSLNNGSPVYYRGVQVGQIESHNLAEDNESVTISAFIWKPYDKLVRTNARFWNMSGVNASMGTEGVKLQTSTLETLLSGGVGFETPITATPAPPAQPGATFKLYESHQAVHQDKPHDLELTYIAYFDDPVRGLHAGAPVSLKGIQIGTVTRVMMEYDSSSNSIRTPILMELEPDNITGMSSGTRQEVRKIISTLVAEGLRAQLQTGSFLTGELFVELNFHPEKPARLVGGSKFPELPTIPSKLRALTNRIERIMAKVEGLPLEKMVEGAIGVTEDARALLRRVDPMATDLEKTLSNADKTMASIQSMIAPNSVMRYDLGTALEEAATAMRSVRILANYLERHPDALIYGKFRSGGR